jgi:hypothetical protein
MFEKAFIGNTNRNNAEKLPDELTLHRSPLLVRRNANRVWWLPVKISLVWDLTFFIAQTNAQ